MRGLRFKSLYIVVYCCFGDNDHDHYIYKDNERFEYIVKKEMIIIPRWSRMCIVILFYYYSYYYC